jgi:DNA-binding GntR family transcriptional regulator
MADHAAISRSVLSDQVKDRLLQAILDGRYPPGARIVETRVARELGTSQAPVREALRDLEALGVVETAAFRGARVRRPSAAELLEAFAIRAELESLAARLAIPRLRVWRTLEPFSRTHITIVAPGADRRQIADAHLPVLDALRRRDTTLAVEVLHEHFANAAANLARHWGDAEASVPTGPADDASVLIQRSA